MSVSGPSPHRPQGPIDQRPLARPLQTASALLQSAIGKHDAPSLTGRASFPHATEQSRAVDDLQQQLREAQSAPPRVPIWKAILTLGILPAIRSFQHGKKVQQLEEKLRQAKAKQILAVLEDQQGDQWLAAGRAPVRVQFTILHRFDRLSLDEKQGLATSLNNAWKSLGNPEHSAAERRWAEQLADRAKRLEATRAISPEDLETALLDPKGSSFTREVDPLAWLNQTEKDPISVELENRLIKPGNDWSGVWAGESIQLIDNTGRDPKTVLVEGASKQASTKSASEQVAKLLPVKRYGNGPLLDESKVQDPDRAYTTDLEQKSELLVSLVNTESRAFVENLKQALQLASNGLLNGVGDTKAAQTLTLYPGMATVGVKGEFELELDGSAEPQSQGKKVETVTCTYTVTVDTTGTADDLRKRIQNARGQLTIDVKKRDSAESDKKNADQTNDSRLSPPEDLQECNTLSTSINWLQSMPGIDTFTVADQNNRAWGLAYKVYKSGGPGTRDGKEALLQLCYLCASYFKDPGTQGFQSQIVDPLDALRAVETPALEAGYDPVSFVDAFDVIKTSLKDVPGDLTPWIFGPGAPGSPVSDVLREAWSKDHPKPSPETR
jgi:hypothetical protein